MTVGQTSGSAPSVRLADTPVLQTERLVLRAPAAEDWEAWRAFFVSDRARFIRPGAPSDAAAWRAFGHAIGHWVMRGFGMFVFAARGGDTALGMAGPWFPAGWPEREIGWTVWAEEAEGRGFAFEAAMAARRYAYDRLGWPAAVSYIEAGNTRSIALAERMGAVHDAGASAPDWEDGAEVRVYRHPAPEALR